MRDVPGIGWPLRRTRRAERRPGHRLAVRRVRRAERCPGHRLAVRRPGHKLAVRRVRRALGPSEQSPEVSVHIQGLLGAFFRNQLELP